VAQQTRDAEEEWEFATLALANAATGFTDTERARRWADAFRTGMTAKAYVAYRDAAEKIDVRDVLPQISAPTIVIHDRSLLVDRLGVLAQRLAPLIPNARLVETRDAAKVVDEFLREGGLSSQTPAIAGKGGPNRGIVGTVLEAVNSFEERDTKRRAQRKRQSKREAAVRTILFTDIVGHTEMMQRLGDERGREVLREHERITREVLKARGGTEVKTMGDGFMASFGSVTRAVECAVALQRAFETALTPLPSPVRGRGEGRISIRIGLNAGEPIEEEGDLFGATVILASRIAGKAEGGEILCSDVVRGLCSGKGFLFADRGEFVAKGFEEPVRVWAVVAGSV